MIRKLMITFALLVAAGSVAAQHLPVKIEWGVLAGINIPDYSSNDTATDITNKLGWQAGMTVAADFGMFAIEPQILYVRQGLRMRKDGERVKLRSNSIDVPVLASFRMLRPVRLYAGPVFTVMNDCKQKSGGDLLDFSRIRPTISYTVGAGLVLGHKLIDFRYNGQFRSKHDVALPDGTELDKLRSYSIAISFGYIF